MQGIIPYIPVETKVKYINSLLKVGYEIVDFGSFVSPKAIPQMKDSALVLKKLDLSNTNSKLLAIVANLRGATDAAQFDEITYLGYPFSISETFQLRNTNATIDESIERVKRIQNLANKKNKKLQIYISMGFGNPYGDEWNFEVVEKRVSQLINIGIRRFALSDTIGVATPISISYLFSELIPAFPKIDFGAHLHTLPSSWMEKIEAAYNAGCRKFDTAIKGYGGCPMAKDDLTGNMPTENLLYYTDINDIPTNIDKDAFINALVVSNEVFVH